MKHGNQTGRTRYEQVSLETIREAVIRGEIRDVQRAEVSLETEPELMDDLKYPEWQEPFRQALLEVNRVELQKQLRAVETAIAERLQSIANDPAQKDECQSISDALSTIRILKRETA